MHSHPQLPSARRSRPFLKWPGGKTRVLDQLLSLLPPRGRLIEPFVGAGSVFLAAGFERCVINDANPDLIAVWVALQARPDEFIGRSAKFFVEANRSKEAYLRIRREFNDGVDHLERAVRLLYLNRLGFNGLYRVNRSGIFNVPYGDPRTVPGFPREQLAAAAERLQTCTILSGDFAAAVQQAGAGDVLYCDPPYSPAETGSSFVSYTAEGFGPSEHAALVEECIRAVGRGAVALISNHDTIATRALYRGWRIEELSVRRSIAANGGDRRSVKELVAILPPDAVPRGG